LQINSSIIYAFLKNILYMTDKERIKEIINFSKMSVRRFGEHIGLKTPQILYDIIKGRNGISKDLAEKISAKCLNFKFTWILTGEGDMLVSEPLVSEISDYREKYYAQLEEYNKEIKRFSMEKDRLNAEIKDALQKMLILKETIHSLEIEKLLEAEKKNLLVARASDVITALMKSAS
jgi:hypothetical protein